MDKIADRLREDAARIDAPISAEFDGRIQASLRNISPEPQRPAARAPHPVSLWWASSLTGAAVALGVIALVNIDRSDAPLPLATKHAAQQIEIPGLELNVEAAMLTTPLARELANLQADLEMAEQAVREDASVDFRAREGSP